jgi:hypothetical protein
MDAGRVVSVSPDLRFAVVMREHPVDDAGGGPLVVSEFGVLDTSAGRVVGRLEIDAWNDPRSGYVVSQAAWSPDGAHLVLSVRHGIAGRGWQAERLLFVDALTGSVQAAEIQPNDGLEPLDLLGWTTDSRAVVLTADQMGTDQAPSGHLVFDEAGKPVAAVHWSEQAAAVMVTGRNELGIVSEKGDRAKVLDVRTGAVRQQKRLDARVPTRGEPLAWREGEVIVRPEDCDAGGCVGGLQIVGLTLETGESRVLHRLDEAQQDILVAPANGLALVETAPAW